MKLVKLLFPVITLTLSAFLVQAEHASDPSLVGEGAKIYSENCGRCHNARPAEEYSKKEWSVVIPHMRAKAHMTAKEALAVEAFLASTLTSDVQNQVNAGALKNKPQRSGEELIAAFGCQGCHKINGAGGALGSDLTGVVDKRGVEFIFQKLTEPTFNNPASAMPKYPMSEADKKVIVELLTKQ